MKVDLHVHSTHSGDGKQTVSEILERCRAEGIKAVAITDHNVLRAKEEADQLSDHGVMVIPAEEVTSTEGHILGLGIDKEIPRGLSVRETIDLIHQAGGIAIAPHPFRLFSGLGKKNVEGMPFDAIEVVNGRSVKRVNGKAFKLAREMEVAEVGGSDAHSSVSLGRTYTIVPDECNSSADIIQAIREKKCRAEGASRSRLHSLIHGGRSLLRWFGRGFKKL